MTVGSFSRPGNSFSEEPVTAIQRVDAAGALRQLLRGERAPTNLAETRDVLSEIARRKSGHMPAALLVEQALKVTEGTDWPCRRAALDALLRRLGFAVRDELTIADRPAAGSVLGRYGLASSSEVGRAGAKLRARRPYQTELYALEPLHVSCDCADFVRSSLGLCKHLLVVLEDLARTPRRWKAGVEQQAGAHANAPRLAWEPIRSWTGTGDRLAGLRWRHGKRPSLAPQNGRKSSSRTSLGRIAESFDGELPLPSVLASADGRFALLEALETGLIAELFGAEPAAAAVVRAELELERRRRAGRAGAKAALSQLRTLKRKLYPYQLDGVRRLLEEQRLLLADDMGLGKTTQAIAACHALFASGRVRRGLLIVPAPLKTQWLREWHATTDRVPLSLVEGQKPERNKLYRRTKQGFLVMNYEQLLRDLDEVLRFAPEVVVLDEAQRIKNWATKSNAHVMSLQPEWRLVLTGTPLENRLEELATLLDWIDDSALVPKWRLAPWHTEWHTEGRTERVGARHLETLRQRVSHCLLRRVRRDVLTQLPPRTDVRLPIEMTEQQREEHDARIVSIAQLMQIARRRPLLPAEFLKLMQLLAQQRIISNGMALFRFDDVWPLYSRSVADEALLATSGSPKLGEFRRLILDLALTQERKVVVFSQWRKMLRLAHWAVEDVLAGAGLRAVFFTGEESQRTRTQNVVDFHDDASVRVMFLSDAGGVGLNLQRAASACINLELPWNPAVLEQRVGRIYRLGQTQPIDVINLVSEYGIEARIAGLIASKEALFSGLFDGTTDTVRFDRPSGFLQDIERLVEQVKVPALSSDTENPADLPEAADVDEPPDAAEPDPHAPSTRAEAEPAPSPADVRTRPTVSEAGAQPAAAMAPAPTGHDASASEPEQRQTGAREVTPGSAASPVQSLFQRMTVTRTETGALRLEAPPDAAQELAQLLQGLASLLGAAASAR